MKAISYKELTVWKKSMDLVVLVYEMTNSFPKHETYGLVAQMRRSAASIPSNIAEGNGRGTRKEYRQFLQIAYGSGAELETQLEVMRRLHYGTEKAIATAENILTEIMKMLNSLLSKLKQSLTPNP